MRKSMGKGGGLGAGVGSRAGVGDGSRAGAGTGSRAGVGAGSRAGAEAGSRAGAGAGSWVGSWAETLKPYAICGLGAGAVVYLFYHSLMMAALATGLAFPLARLYRRRQEEQRRKLLSWQFRDLLYSLSGSFATGRQMKEALVEAEENLKLIYGEGEPIRQELARMTRQIRDQQVSDEEVWREFAERSRLEDVRNFAEVYGVCKRSGGNLERVVMKGAAVLAEKISIQKEIHTLTVQKRWEAKILTAMPLLVIFFLQAASPEYMEVMYSGLTGRLLMTLALLAITGAYLWSLKLTEVEV